MMLYLATIICMYRHTHVSMLMRHNGILMHCLHLHIHMQEWAMLRVDLVSSDHRISDIDFEQCALMMGVPQQENSPATSRSVHVLYYTICMMRGRIITAAADITAQYMQHCIDGFALDMSSASSRRLWNSRKFIFSSVVCI